MENNFHMIFVVIRYTFNSVHFLNNYHAELSHYLIF